MIGNSGATLSDLARSAMGGADAYAQKLAPLGAAALVFWAVALTTTAIFVFRAQDLSKE